MAQPILHHRHAEFIALSKRINRHLQVLFCTEQPVLTLTSSGTGAAESAITSLFARGETGININNGKFAERWGKMMTIFGMNTVEVMIPWGHAVSEPDYEPLLVEALRAHPQAACVWLVHSETSTGTFTDIRRMAELIRTHSSALVCIDGITSVGAHECRTDEWGLDVVITGSQKGLMIPPGLSFIALSERAWKRVYDERADKIPSFYFSLAQARKEWESNSTPWTPAVTLFVGLDKALDMLVEEGIEHVWKRHELLAHGMRAGVQALGLELFSSSPSNAVTTVHLPPAGKHLVSLLKQKYSATVIGGQDSLKDKIFRISHLGFYDEGDMLALLGVLEHALHEIGQVIQPGSGVAAAQRAFMGVA